MYPLNPPILGDLLFIGGHPQTLGRKNPAPPFLHSYEMGRRMIEGAGDGLESKLVIIDDPG
jgi:hypothetical protein